MGERYPAVSRIALVHIGIAGPIATENIAHLLHGNTAVLPIGYHGAPLLTTLIDALLARGHRVTAFTMTTGRPRSDYGALRAEGEQFAIYYVPMRARAFRLSGGHVGRGADFYRAERLGLERAMREANPDVIHAHWSYEFGLAAIASGLPHVITCHDAPQAVLRYMRNLYRLMRYFMGRRCLARAHCLTAVSPYLRDKIAHYARASISVVPNPLPPRLTDRAVDLSRLPNPLAPRLTMVANGWGPLKNPQPALRAFARLHARTPGARLRLYGADFGPGQTAERWARQQGVATGMEFLGPTPYARLLEELSTADVLVHPSLEESFGMSVAEAMALGVPVVGGERSGAVPWVIGEGGLVTDVTSASAIEKALDTLLHIPDEYRRRTSAAVVRARLMFSASQVADTYLSHYCDAVGETSASARTSVGMRA